MKRMILLAGLAVGFMACNNDNAGKDTAETDSTDHSAHSSGTASGTDTAGMAGKSMMSIMQSNMDQMKGMSSTGNPDNDFAALMKVHHMGAIEMAQLELVRGTD